MKGFVVIPDSMDKTKRKSSAKVGGAVRISKASVRSSDILRKSFGSEKSCNDDLEVAGEFRCMRIEHTMLCMLLWTAHAHNNNNNNN